MNTNRSINRDEYIKVTSAAYKELIDQDCRQFIIEPDSFTFTNNEIVIASMQEYATKTRATIFQVLPNNCRDGYVCRNARPGVNLILYNENARFMRKRFTVAHEIGHIRLDHMEHTDLEEAEAHLFACQILSPDIIWNWAKKHGALINPAIISSICGISSEAAQRKFIEFNSASDIHTDYDDMLIANFENSLNYYFTRSVRHVYRRELDIYAE